ncbi:metallophosphoesterase family protein [Sphingomonas qomolangmaensis]|uniref:Serine/threonine protein phosphatase n=1 Tax=Sphingomonas qomolangmaensis TaxID=2918765 RepID=A0ABY5LA48_9SPHN|nr:metallophosphoesterase family protein [Sphingomonas qomolangmaensis]UUL83016.1 serine/threonine protein phosphatase [Sphingomonas qomolangmaensis]
MIQRIFRKTKPKQSRIPEGQRVYAIGDIHGCLAETETLLAKIEHDNAGRPAAETHLIFLGDLMDRGPDSAGVIEKLRTLSLDWATPRFLTGNHEELFLGALAGERDALKVFARAGGRETMQSYGMSPAQFDEATWDDLEAHLPTLVSDEHRAFIEGFETMLVFGDYLFVHAGIRPDVPLDEQRTSDLFWIREPFLSHRGSLSHVVVHGHTVTEAVDERRWRIGIDTGAYGSGRLTAIGLQGTERWFLSTLD